MSYNLFWEKNKQKKQKIMSIILEGIKNCLLLGRKDMTYLDSILKSRDITLLAKVHIVKAMVFPVVIMDVRVGP